MMQPENVGPNVVIDEAALRAMLPKLVDLLNELRDQKLLLRPETVAFILDIDPRTLRNLISAGVFPQADKVLTNKLKYWKRETVRAWIEKN